jgi:hypothetical protein
MTYFPRKKGKMVQHLVYEGKGYMMRTQYGLITYLQWCEKERDRILKNPDRKAEIRMTPTRCALYVDDLFEMDKNKSVRMDITKRNIVRKFNPAGQTNNKGC